MLTGIDTGFFFALEEQDPVAIRVWKEREIITSPVVLYEIQKKLLQEKFKRWPTIIEDIEKAVVVTPLTVKTALKAGHLAHGTGIPGLDALILRHLAHGTGIPGLDALILSSLLEAECKEIYTTDRHFELYKSKGVKIINLLDNSNI